MSTVELRARLSVIVESNSPHRTLVCGYLAAKILVHSSLWSIPVNCPKGVWLTVDMASVAAAHPPAAPHPMYVKLVSELFWGIGVENGVGTEG
jgi:hypothetical protein